MSFHVPEKLRVRTGYLASSEANGNNGAFFLRLKPGAPPLQIIASDGDGYVIGEEFETDMDGRQLPATAQRSAP